eukprot:SAG31_NODE_15917_length_732_cov_0.635071_1_plen_148_part_00
MYPFKITVDRGVITPRRKNMGIGRLDPANVVHRRLLKITRVGSAITHGHQLGARRDRVPTSHVQDGFARTSSAPQRLPAPETNSPLCTVSIAAVMLYALASRSVRIHEYPDMTCDASSDVTCMSILHGYGTELNCSAYGCPPFFFFF